MPKSDEKSDPATAAPPLPFWGLIWRNARLFVSVAIHKIADLEWDEIVGMLSGAIILVMFIVVALLAAMTAAIIVIPIAIPVVVTILILVGLAKMAARIANDDHTHT